MSNFIEIPPANETKLWIVARYLASRQWVRYRLLRFHPDTLWRDPLNWYFIYDVDAAFHRQREREFGHDIPLDAPPFHFTDDTPNKPD